MAIQALRLLLIYMFVNAGVLKLVEGRHAAVELRRALPALGGQARLVASFGGCVECLTALLLLVPQNASFGLLAASATLTTLSAVLGLQVAVGARNAPCSCGPGASNSTTAQGVARNVLLQSAILLALADPWGAFSASAIPEAQLKALGAAAVLFVLLPLLIVRYRAYSLRRRRSTGAYSLVPFVWAASRSEGLLRGSENSVISETNT
jgi:hypothetical protein